MLFSKQVCTENNATLNGIEIRQYKNCKIKYDKGYLFV